MNLISINNNELENIINESERLHREQLDRETTERWERRRKEKQERVNRDQAIFALMDSRSIMEAARRSGISRGTFYNLMKDPDFMAAFNDLKKEQRDRLEDEFFELGKSAGEVIKGLLETQTESHLIYDVKLDPVYKLKINTALRVLEMASRIHTENMPANTGTQITAKATIPANSSGIAGAFVMAEKKSIESVQNCSGSV